MLEERAHEFRVASNLRELLVNPWLQLFSFLQGAPCDAGTLDVTPHQFIRIEIRRVTRREMQSQFALGTGDVLPRRYRHASVCLG